MSLSIRFSSLIQKGLDILCKQFSHLQNFASVLNNARGYRNITLLSHIKRKTLLPSVAVTRYILSLSKSMEKRFKEQIDHMEDSWLQMRMMGCKFEEAKSYEKQLVFRTYNHPWSLPKWITGALQKFPLGEPAILVWSLATIIPSDIKNTHPQGTVQNEGIS